MKRNFAIINLIISVQLTSYSAVKDFTKFVNPFIGTQHEGHCFPGATVPGGMVQPSPETYNVHYPGYEMDHVAGYQYNDPYIWGFAQTHLNGAGCPSLSDILVLPYCGKNIDASKRENFKTSYRKKTEEASPGYYTVYLNDHSVRVEVTATEHVAYYRCNYKKPKDAKLLVDLQYGVSWDINNIWKNVTEASQTFEDEYTLTGYRLATEWASRKLFYVIKFNKPIKSKLQLVAPEGKTEIAPRYELVFDMLKDAELEFKIALSTTSIQEAKNNLNGELPEFGKFEITRNKAEEKWNNILSMFELSGKKQTKTMFYTSLYQLYIQPNNIADVSGFYRGENDSIYKSPFVKFYSTLSLWDTYRAANPMYTLLTPELVKDYVASMIESYQKKSVNPNNPLKANKFLPRWGLWGKETNTMIGNHAVSVIVEAWLKNIHPIGYTDSLIYDALWNSVTKPHFRNHTQLIDKYGYIPYDTAFSVIDDGRETVSRLLEGTYNDYALALMAKKLGRETDYQFLMNRAGCYRNVYDTVSGFMRGKNKNGKFKQTIDPTEVVGEWLPESDFTEGNAYHYQFHVQHDVPGLISLNGGKKVFAEKLDSIFCNNTNPKIKNLVWNIWGNIGQYWHGNEPCHHVPYLYKYTDKAYMTDYLIRYLVENFNETNPGGLKGNVDCGQMSAWYMFAVMGFYPVNPVSGEYVLGAPQVPYLKILLPNNEIFEVEAQNFSVKNFEVESGFLNNKKLERNYITHQEILAGGKLTFVYRKNDSNNIKLGKISK